jgi:hypothetical protein
LTAAKDKKPGSNERTKLRVWRTSETRHGGRTASGAPTRAAFYSLARVVACGRDCTGPARTEWCSGSRFQDPNKGVVGLFRDGHASLSHEGPSPVPWTYMPSLLCLSFTCSRHLEPKPRLACLTVYLENKRFCQFHVHIQLVIHAPPLTPKPHSFARTEGSGPVTLLATSARLLRLAKDYLFLCGTQPFCSDSLRE